MNDLVIGNTNEHDAINVGDESAGKKISFQLAQDFYNEITGKSERLTDKIKSSYVLTLADIENLNHRIVQSTEQYNIVSQNATFSVRYVGDSSERFSSLDRLRIHAGHKGLPVEEVDITYKLLVVLPKTQRPQEYTIRISFVSRVAKIEEMRKTMADAPFAVPFFHFEGLQTGNIVIDFVDISVANAIMATIKSWADCLKKRSTNEFIKIARRKSHYFPIITKYSFVALCAYHIHQYSSPILAGSPPIKIAVNFALASVLIAYLSLKIGAFIGRKAEKSIDEVYEISYIHFSSADENLVEETEAKITRSVISSLGALIAAFLIGIASSIAATLMIG